MAISEKFEKVEENFTRQLFHSAAEELNVEGTCRAYMLRTDFTSLCSNMQKWIWSPFLRGRRRTLNVIQKLRNNSSLRTEETQETLWNKERGSSRPGTLSHQLTLLLIITTIFAFLPSSLAASGRKVDEERLVCMEGVSPPLPGATFPRGDIFLKVGDTLEVFCRLNLTNPAAAGYNASNIDFVFTKAHISYEDVVKRVVNESTAVVRVKHMNSSSPFLRCVLNRPDGSQIPVCQNQIDVGYAPLPVEDFRCVSREWKSLNCTWRLPSNPIPTKYTLTKIWPRYRTAITPCPNTTATPTSCVWDGRTEPHYRQNMDPLNLRLNGTNALMPSGITWDYSYSLWSIVIPEKPRLFITKNSITNYMVNWTFLEYEYFKPGLEHQLTVCDDEDKCTITDYKTKPVEGKMVSYLIKNVSLPYANTNYTISVRLRSPSSNRTEEFWSEPEIQSVITDARAPDSPPETDLGSFENAIRNDDHRDIYIYWKSIRKQERNGPRFMYDIGVYEDNKELPIKPNVISDSYAKFVNLSSKKSYQFTIASVNAKGRSENSSEVTVPPVGEPPEEPKSVSKVDYTNGSYEISWRRPDQYKGIQSYTIFRCGSKKPRPYPCESRLEWDRVDVASAQSETIHKFYDVLPQHDDHIYEFAISANTDNAASGMVWATCTLIHDKVPGKLRRVSSEEQSEDEILIRWYLDCSYKSGDIEGFIITYCQVEKYPTDRCKDDERSVAVEGANKTTYRLRKLKPYSYYKIYVSILAAAGQSQRSDPIVERTSEGAPSSATISKISRVTNESAAIEIKSPDEWNGALREYRVYYRSKWDEREEELVVPLEASNETKSFSIEVILKNLSSNSNYTVYVVSCNRKCSLKPPPVSFLTDIGRTDLTMFPKMKWSNDLMTLEWDKPSRLGGHITSFQVMLMRDGKAINYESDYPTVEYYAGAKSFYKEIRQSCEPNTNFTAQIRAVTKVDGGQYLYGAWSPPGNYLCGGTTHWGIWVILAVVIIMAVIFFVYAGAWSWQYIKKMREGLIIKVPPGLNSELNGFAKQPPRGRSTDNLYGNETCAYPLQPTSSRDESKDFLSSSDLNQGEAEESLIEKPFPSPTNPLLGSHFSTVDNGNTDDEENHIPLTEYRIHEEPHSSPTYKKIGLMNGSVVSKDAVAGPSSHSTPSHSEADELSSTSANTISQISNHLGQPPGLQPPLTNGINRPVPDVLNSSPSSPTSLNNRSSSPPTPVGSPAIQVPIQPQSSSYVKWTTLVPDMKTGDAQPVLDNRQSTYCQVGILLDS